MMCIALSNKLTVADLKQLSYGYVVDVCDTRIKLIEREDIHEEEKRFEQLRESLPLIIKRFENGEISQQKYDDFMILYKELEDVYG